MTSKRLIRSLLVASTVALACVAARAQTSSIHGIVSDSLTGERIPYANVILAELNRGTAANAEGFYLIPNLNAGTYELSVSSVGYRKKIQTIVVPAGQSVDIPIRLVPQAIETEEIVVSGTRGGRLSEIGTSIHIMTPKEITIAPVTAQGDVLQSLQMLPGFVSTSDVSSRFFVRGGAGDQNLVLLDGMKIYSPFHALGVFSVFDPDIIKSVEVYTGAFPAEFGGRLSSIVNINSKEPRLDRYSAKAHVNSLSSKFELQGPVSKGISWMANGRKSLFAQTFKRIVRDDVPLSFYDLYVKGTAQPGGNMKIDVAYLTAVDDLNYTNPLNPDYLWQGKAFSASVSDLLGNKVFIRINAYYTAFTAERVSDPFLNQPPTSTSIKDNGLRVNATAYVGTDDLVQFGFESSFPALEYQLVNTVGTPLTLKETIPSIYLWVQYQGKAGDFQYTVGFHSELTDLYYRGNGDGIFQPRISVSYLYAGNWRLKMSYGHVRQSVMTVSNEDDIVPAFEGWIAIPAKLPAQTADHFVAGIEGNLSENISLTAEAYYKYYGTLLAYNRGKIDAADPDYFPGTGRSYGTEILLRAKYMFIDFYGAYTLSWARLNNKGLSYYPRYDRRHHLNGLVSAELLKSFNVSLRWEYGSGFPYTPTIGFFDRLMLHTPIPADFEYEAGDPYTLLGAKNAGRLPPYHRLDLSLTYHVTFWGIQASAGVNLINLYSSKNMFYYDRTTGSRVNMIPFFPSVGLTLEY